MRFVVVRRSVSESRFSLLLRIYSANIPVVCVCVNASHLLKESKFEIKDISVTK